MELHVRMRIYFPVNNVFGRGIIKFFNIIYSYFLIS